MSSDSGERSLYRAGVAVLMWAILAILALVVVTWAVGVSRFAFLALVHDSFPMVLTLAWLVLGYGLGTEQWALAGVAGVFVAIHLAVVVPRVLAAPVPEWVNTAPRLSVALANVFVDNQTPNAAATELVATRSDLLVIAERTDAFMQEFRSVHGDVVFPFRIDGPSDRVDYAMTIASRVAFLPESEVVRSGPLTVVRAVVECGARPLAVIGVHLSAAVAKGGYRMWRREMSELREFVATLTPPFVLIGDFNSSRFRPEFARFVRAARLSDVHGGVGKGLTRSLKLSDRGLFAQVPALTRVDHALVSDGVHAVDVRNLPTLGSDHHPFVATLAVQPEPVSNVCCFPIAEAGN